MFITEVSQVLLRSRVSLFNRSPSRPTKTSLDRLLVRRRTSSLSDLVVTGLYLTLGVTIKTYKVLGVPFFSFSLSTSNILL